MAGIAVFGFFIFGKKINPGQNYQNLSQNPTNFPTGELTKLLDLRSNSKSDFYQTNLKCQIPVKYSIGYFDPRFGISRQEFLTAIDKASAIWESGTGKKLFEYDPNGPLKINLVFDARQEDTSILKIVGTEITADQNNYNALKNEYDSTISNYNTESSKYADLKSQYNQAYQQYDNLSQQYGQQLQNLNSQIDYWNSQGGAPPKEYDKLITEENSLNSLYSRLEDQKQVANRLADQVNQEQSAVNDLASQVNNLAGILNRLADKMNLQINKYDSVQTDIGTSFTQGLYHYDSETGAEINIYQFYDQNNDLVIVLAHELGHALGLGHVSDPQSIMYYLMGKQEFKLTREDLLAFKK